MAITENENSNFFSRKHLNEQLSKLKGKIIKESAGAAALFTLALPAMYASMLYPGPGATSTDVGIVLAWDIAALAATYGSMFGGVKLATSAHYHNQERNNVIQKAQKHGFQITGILFKQVK
ncbi:hypothetical protein HYT02_05550 [Candidatus Gottesmanbacteria bacterium]|nr:hypothetical protein [Candidatus Gottesmanbacteria bacterium]